MRMHDQWAGMRDAIELHPQFLAEAPLELYHNSADVVPPSTPSRIYLVGCGDSHYSGVAARYALEHWTGIPTEALSSMEFSRYALRGTPTDALVIAVSNSGEVARTVEGARYADHRGLWVTAVTGKPSSRLAEASRASFNSMTPAVSFGPGTISYTATTLALLVLGLRIASKCGRLDDRAIQVELARIQVLGDIAANTLKHGTDAAQLLARHLTPQSVICIIGAGPNHGTALFGAAKMIEAGRHNTVAQELEEWAHEQYFVTGQGAHTIVVACPGASLDRAREEITAIRKIGGTATVICAADDDETMSLADIVLPVAGVVDELLSPLVYSLGLQLMAYHYGIANEASMLDIDNPLRNQVNFQQIFDSAIPPKMPPLGGRP